MLAKIEDSNKTRIFVTYMLAKKMAILWQYFGYHKITITFMLAHQNGTILAILASRYLYVGVVTFNVGKLQKLVFYNIKVNILPDLRELLSSFFLI